MITYANLKDKPQEFLAATSLAHDEFLRLLPVFREAYLASLPTTTTLEGKVRRRKTGAGAKGTLQTMEDKLLFILVHEKTYPLQTMQGLHFGLSQPQANYWIHRLLPILRQALKQLHMLPEREASIFAAHRPQETPADLLMDGTERRRQRPQDAAEQTEHYSGKKKTHTDKNLLLVNTQTDRVEYLGPTEPGSRHDKKMADGEPITYPPGTTLGKDLGFQGYAPARVITHQPKKKPKGRPLEVSERFLNGIVSGVRIRVEHVIAGVKRCRIVKDVFRNLKEGFSDLVMEVACALHNFRISCRHPQLTVNLLDFVIQSNSR
jgi:hypothetical protein